MIPTAFFKLRAISDSACLRQFAIVVKFFIVAIFAIPQCISASSCH